MMMMIEVTADTLSRRALLSSAPVADFTFLRDGAKQSKGRLIYKEGLSSHPHRALSLR